MQRTVFLALQLSAAACNATSEGAAGLVAFTPDRCDAIGSGCSFERDLAAGGVLEVQIAGVDGFSTVALDLASSEPGVLEVRPVADRNDRPTWEIYGAGAGVGRLTAVDRDGGEVDFIEVPVQELDGLALKPFIGDAVGPASDVDFDEIWTVNAAQSVSFAVRSFAGTAELMGRVGYDVNIDSGLADAMLEGAEPAEGYLYFEPPAGDYAVIFRSSNGTGLTALFQAE